MAKNTKKGELPEVNGLRPTEKQAVTVRVGKDVRGIVDEVQGLYAEKGVRISKNAVYEEGVREYWTKILEGARK